MDGNDRPTVAQVRAGRALLGWSQDRLAEAAGIGRATVIRFENGTASPTRANLGAMKAALEKEGVRFLVLADGEGVVLARRSTTAA